MTVEPVSLLALAGGVYWSVAVALLLVSAAAVIVQPWLAERRARNAERPPVSIVLPIKLDEENFARAQASALEQDYPDFEVVAAAVEEDSPAVRKMRELLARYPNVPSRILRSTAKFAASPKLDNLFAPITQAANDVILQKDANMLLERDDLAQTSRHLADDVGLVCAISYVAKPPNFAAHVEAGVINGPHARMLFLAAALGLGFGTGKFMLFRRSDFLRAGGFAAIAHTVGEDNAMSKALKRIGLRTVFSHRAVPQELGRRSFSEVWDRQIRWSVVRRADEPFSFLLEPLCQALPAFAAAYVAAPLSGLSPAAGAAVTFALWLAVETSLFLYKGWPTTWLAPAVFLGREALMLASWLRAWATNRVVWANNTFDARADEGALRPAPAAAKKEG